MGFIIYFKFLENTLWIFRVFCHKPASENNANNTSGIKIILYGTLTDNELSHLSILAASEWLRNALFMNCSTTL